jgi:hypothetical protein
MDHLTLVGPYCTDLELIAVIKADFEKADSETAVSEIEKFSKISNLQENISAAFVDFFAVSYRIRMRLNHFSLFYCCLLLIIIIRKIIR